MIRSALLSLIALGLAAQTPAPAPATAGKAAPAPAAKPAAAPAAAPAPAPKVDKILGRVDGVAGRESEMEVMLASLNPQQKQQMAAAGMDKAIQNYLEFRLLAAKAKRDGLDKTDGYKKKVAFAMNQLLAMEYLAKEGPVLQAKATPTEAQVKAYFDSNKAAFATPGKFNARHILVKTKGGPNGEAGLGEEDAKKKAAEIQAEFAKGGKWDDLAKKYSEDPGSKDKGGLYEGISFGSFVPEFEAAVKKQEIGKVGEPVKSMFGYHVIQVESRTEAETPEFEKVKDQVRQRVGAEAQERVWKELVEEIKKQVPMVVGEAAAKEPAAKPKPAKKAAAAGAAK